MKTVATAIGSMIAALLLAAPALGAPGWLPAQEVSEFDATAPQIIMDAAGNATAIWEQYDGEDNLVQASTRPAGGEWASPTPLSAPGEEARKPRLAIDAAGNVTAVWLNFGDVLSIVSARKPADGAWSPAVPVRELDGFLEEPQIAVDDSGNATAAWIEKGDPEDRVAAARKPVGGAWGSRVLLSDPDAEIEEPQLASTGEGDVVATWTVEAGAYDRVQAAWRPVGGDWSEPFFLSEDGGTARDQWIAAGQKVAYVIWTRRDEDDFYRAQATRMAPDGTWEEPLTISEPGVSASNARIAVDRAGGAVAIWTQTDGSHSRVKTATRSASGGAWSEPETLSDPGANAQAPAVAADEQTAVVVWERFDGTFDRVEAATRASGGEWKSPEDPLSSPTGDANAPQVAVDGSGDAFAIWELWNADDPIEAAAYDNSLPELRSLSIPPSGKVGEPLAFSVSPFDAFAPLGPVQWSFGDGGGTTGASVTHAYAKPGDYTVSVKVADLLGNETSAAGSVEIASPRARARAERKVKVNLKRGVAIARLRCPDSGQCSGPVKLSSQGKRRARVYGRTTVDLAAGEQGKARVKLNRKGKKRLRPAAAAKKKSIRAKISGAAVRQRSVVLQLPRR